MNGNQAAFLGAGVLGLVLFLYFLGSILGLVVFVGIGCGLGLLAEHIYPSPYRNGRLSATGLGLSGALVGGFFLGHWGPSVAGVYLVPSLIGALGVSAGLRGKVRYDRLKLLEDHQAAAGDDPLLMSLIEDYRLLKSVGKGAFAKVYQAVPDRTLREADSVAIKVFSESALETDDFVGRVEREVALCQKLNHPNIMKILKSGQQNKVHYLIMEFVAGTTLRHKMNQGRMELGEACKLLSELSLALGHAHSQGIIHRDIKPDNVMLTSSGPKIMDFGLARLEGKSDLTQTGTAVGTPHYMAPEQVLCNRELDGRCDQYSLGAVAFEMVTGEKLFDGEQTVQIAMQTVQDAPRDPRQLRPEVPERLAKCILRMLAKAPGDRFANMELAAQEFQAYLPGRVS